MKIENVKVYDLEECIKASKYPMAANTDDCNYDITNRTLSLAQSPKGEAHDQFLTGIRVNFDLTFSNKAWVELERYRFIEFVSSQSTMHKIAKLDMKKQCNEYVDGRIIDIVQGKVWEYESMIEDNYPKEVIADKYLDILYNVPSGFELTARLTTNYRALKAVYSQRKNHRLPEWREFCKWIETLPHSELIIG